VTRSAIIVNQTDGDNGGRGSNGRKSAVGVEGDAEKPEEKKWNKCWNTDSCLHVLWFGYSSLSLLPMLVRHSKVTVK
jgi:hypothetical protein